MGVCDPVCEAVGVADAELVELGVPVLVAVPVPEEVGVSDAEEVPVFEEVPVPEGVRVEVPVPVGVLELLAELLLLGVGVFDCEFDELKLIEGVLEELKLFEGEGVGVALAVTLQKLL